MTTALIAGRYAVLRAIGRGGMGTVWLCRDEKLGRDVAVKQMGGVPGEESLAAQRAMREARAAAALNHPNAVSVFDLVEHDGLHWLVMEYIDGHTLADELTREGRLDPLRVAGIGAQLAGALSRAHERGIVHRDIKPGNVLIDGAGQPRISDFGIARGHGDAQLTQTGFVTGTPGYLSPELARGSEPSTASDVWALGATLYAAVEGHSPYGERSNPIATLHAIAYESPEPMRHAGPLAPAIEAMMSHDVAGRWDMQTVAARLTDVAGGVEAVPEVAAGATQVLPVLPSQDAGDGLFGDANADANADGPHEPPPATRSLPVGAVGPPHPSAAPAQQPAGRRRLVLALLGVLVLAGLAFAAVQLLPADGDGAGPGTAATASPPSGATVPTPSTASTPSATSTPSPSTAPSATTSSPTTTPTTPTTTASSTTAPPAGTDAEVAAFVTDYFATVTRDRDASWVMLSPRMQAAAGGRAGYDGFWSTIKSVRTNNVKADAATGTVTVRLDYTRTDGTRTAERHELTVIPSGGSYLIDSDRPVG